MKSCINGATTMPYPLKRDIQTATNAGFEGIEIWYPKMKKFLKSHSLTELKNMLQKNHLEVASICPLSIRAFSDNNNSRAELEEAARQAQKLGCDTLLVCPDAPQESIPQSAAWDTLSAEIRECARMVEKRGVKIALEPLGMHPLVPGPREAMEVIKRADHPAVGLIMDTFHYYKSSVKLEDIRSIPVEKMLIVHINDCQSLPKDQLKDSHRLYPGLGVIPIISMLKPLKEKGYQGYLSVEIFREEYWQLPPEEVSRQSKRYLDLVINRL